MKKRNGAWLQTAGHFPFLRRRYKMEANILEKQMFF